jgi:hypothetical protein
MLKKAKVTWATSWIPLGACLLILLFGISPVYLIIAAIIAGIIAARYVANKRE